MLVVSLSFDTQPWYAILTTLEMNFDKELQELGTHTQLKP